MKKIATIGADYADTELGSTAHTKWQRMCLILLTCLVAALVPPVGIALVISLLCIVSIGSVPAALGDMHYKKLYAFKDTAAPVYWDFMGLGIMMNYGKLYENIAAFASGRKQGAVITHFNEIKSVATCVYLKAKRAAVQLLSDMKQHFGGVYSGDEKIMTPVIGVA